MPVIDYFEWSKDFDFEIAHQIAEDTDSFLMCVRQAFAKRNWTRAYDIHMGSSYTCSMVDVSTWSSYPGHG